MLLEFMARPLDSRGGLAGDTCDMCDAWLIAGSFKAVPSQAPLQFVDRRNGALPLVVLAGIVCGLCTGMTFAADRLVNYASDMYACVPCATCMVLSYFDMPEPYDAVLKEIPCDNQGNGNVSDLVALVQRRGLYCRVFQGMTLAQLNSVLSRGFCAVVVADRGESRHASAVFRAGNELLSTDVQSPLHCANLSHLERFLQQGAVCVLVGKGPVPAMDHHWMKWLCVLVIAAVMGGIGFRAYYKGGTAR